MVWRRSTCRRQTWGCRRRKSSSCRTSSDESSPFGPSQSPARPAPGQTPGTDPSPQTREPARKQNHEIRDFTVREIPGTGREIGTRETGGKLDPGNPGKPGNFFGHFLRILKENFENPPFFLQREVASWVTKVSVISAFLHCITKRKGLIHKQFDIKKCNM